MNFITSTGLVFGFTDDNLGTFKLNWWVIMCFITGLRLIDAIWWKVKQNDTNVDTEFAIKRFTISVVITASAWCVYSLTIFATAQPLELAALVCVIAGLVSGAANVFSASRLIATIYASILIVPLAIQAIFSQNPTWETLGFLGLAFLAITVTTARRAHKFTQHAMVLKNQNLELVRDMKLEKDEVGRINEELVNAYTQLNIVNNELEARVKRRTDKIYELSALDPLTGLYNRKAFNAQLRRQLVSCEQQGRSLALLFIDLDGFKKVNDSLSHQVGDEVLVATTQRLKTLVGTQRNLCRWGGDEFLILMEDCSQAQIVEFAESIIAELSMPIATKAETVSIGATIGISIYPQHGSSAEHLIQLADIAMYSQKNIVQPTPAIFSDVMLIGLQRDQRLRDGLSKALEEEQFHLVYQPIIGDANGRPSNCEALLRWTLDGELIPPDEFIPVAEKYGYIRQIGAWVFNQACLDAQSWVDDSIAVSVNASIIQMLSEDMESIITTALNNSGLDPKRLHLELTETVFSSDTPTLQSKIARIQRLGVKICIDDFGTGYSSLSQLQSLAVDVVKIDRAFIYDLQGPGKAIIQAAMHIAKALNYEVIAEGIETEEQAQEIRAMGLKYMQGFHYARPMNKQALLTWLEENKKQAVVDIPQTVQN